MRPGLQAGLFLTLLACYTLSGSREELWGDPKASYRVAEHFVTDGEIDIGYGWPIHSPPAADGKYYAPYGALTSLVQYPVALVQEYIRDHHKGIQYLSFPLLTHLASALCGAGVCLLFFRLCRRRFGLAALPASLATVVLGLATMLFPYARDPFSETLQTLCFTGFFYVLLGILQGDERPRGDPLMLGLWAGLLVNAKSIYALSLIGAAALLVWSLRGDLRRLLRVAALGALGFVPFVAIFVAYNYVRWGTLTEVGLSTNAPLFTQRIIWGLFGFLFSTGKSVFLYSPPLLVALFGMRRFIREHRMAAIAAAVTVLPVILVYTKYALWNGDQAWGPRYLVFLHPLAMVPFAMLIAGGMRRPARWAAVALVIAGFAVQLIGCAIWRGVFFRISRDVTNHWLGEPDPAGSVVQPCMACFEHTYPTVWLPPMNPIDGNLWIVRHILFDDSWEEAAKDAPWRQYTTLNNFGVKPIYDRIRIDWWPILFLKDHESWGRTGWPLFILEILGLGGGAWLWARSVRRLQ